MPTNETKMQMAEDRYSVPEKNYCDIAEDMLTHGEWNGNTIADFQEWAFGKSEQFCHDSERLCVLAMQGGECKTELEEIGQRLFDLMVVFCKEMDK